MNLSRSRRKRASGKDSRNVAEQLAEHSVSESRVSGKTKAPQPVTSPSTTYGVSYHHCSLWRLLRAACGCCPRPPFGLCRGRRRSWPRSTGGLIPDRWRKDRDIDQAEPRSETIHRLTPDMTESTSEDRLVCLLLSSFQSDNDENRPSVHSTHAARVAHEVVQNCGEFCPHLRRMILRVSYVTG